MVFICFMIIFTVCVVLVSSLNFGPFIIIAIPSCSYDCTTIHTVLLLGRFSKKKKDYLSKSRSQNVVVDASVSV